MIRNYQDKSNTSKEASLVKDLESLETERISKSKQVGDLDVIIQGKHEEIALLNSKHAELNKKNSEIVEENKALLKTADDLRKTIYGLRLEVQNSIKESDRYQELTLIAEKNYEDYKNHINSEKQSLNDDITPLKRELETLKESNNTLIDKNTSLEVSISRNTEYLKNQESDIISKEEEYASVQSNVDSKSRELQEIEDTILKRLPLYNKLKE